MTELAIRSQLQLQQRQGRTEFANEECGEPISEMRTRMGARFCVDCHNDIESRERQNKGRRL